MALIRCPYCKALVTDSNRLCQVCGQPLPVSDEAAIQTQTIEKPDVDLTEVPAKIAADPAAEEKPAETVKNITETVENTIKDQTDPIEEIEIDKSSSPEEAINNTPVSSLQEEEPEKAAPEEVTETEDSDEDSETGVSGEAFETAASLEESEITAPAAPDEEPVEKPEPVVLDEEPLAVPQAEAPDEATESKAPEAAPAEAVPVEEAEPAEITPEAAPEEEAVQTEVTPEVEAVPEAAPVAEAEPAAPEEKPVEVTSVEETESVVSEETVEEPVAAEDEADIEDSDEDDEIIAEDTDPGTFSEDIAKILAAVGLESKSKSASKASAANTDQDDPEITVKTIARMVNPDAAEKADISKTAEPAVKAVDASTDAVQEKAVSKAAPSPAPIPAPAPTPAPAESREEPKPEAQKPEPAAVKENTPSEPKPSIKDKGKQIAKSPMLKWVGIVAAIIAIAVIAVFASFEISKMRLYSASAKALEEGSFDVAEEGFASLGSYKDAPDRLLDCKYQSAEKALSEGKYEEASGIFDTLAETGEGGYKDSAEKSKECTYLLAKEHYDKGEYATAGKLFSTLGDYKDAASLYDDSDYQLSPDGAFLREMAAGLTERWTQKESDDSDPNYDEAVAFERLCDIELKHLEPFEEEEFDNAELGKDALEYIGLLREAKEAVSYMEDDYDRYVNIWNDAYADRTKLLQKFVADYGLKVDDNYKGLLESAIKDAGASVIAVDSNEEVKKMASTFRLTLETDDDGNSKHVLHMENTSPYTFDYFAVNVSVIDSDGNTLDAGSSDELSPWEKGERADLTVWLDGSLDPTQYTVKVEPQYYISEDSVDE